MATATESAEAMVKVVNIRNTYRKWYVKSHKKNDGVKTNKNASIRITMSKTVDASRSFHTIRIYDERAEMVWKCEIPIYYYKMYFWRLNEYYIIVRDWSLPKRSSQRYRFFRRFVGRKRPADKIIITTLGFYTWK